MRTTLSIGQVAERTGLSVHTLRFYEREGLFPEPIARVGSRRTYTEDDVEWLELCAILRASGMPLAAVREYTTLVADGDGNEPERLELLREHQRRLRAELAELRRCEDLIRHKVGVYEDIIDQGLAGHDCRPPGA
jgi:DNA-binding transcriptional MerR regulator